MDISMNLVPAATGVEDKQQFIKVKKRLRKR